MTTICREERGLLVTLEEQIGWYHKLRQTGVMIIHTKRPLLRTSNVQIYNIVSGIYNSKEAGGSPG